MKTSALKLLIFSFLVLFYACNDDDDCGCNDGNIVGKWEVKEFMSIESVLYAKDDDYNPTIEFKSDGITDIRLDVNSCFGDYELGDEPTLNISDSGCTEACCDSDFSMKFIEMLPQVGSYEIEDNMLKLYVSGWGWINLKWISD